MSASFMKYLHRRRQIRSLDPESTEIFRNHPEPASPGYQQSAPQNGQAQLEHIRIVSLTENETKCRAFFIAKADEMEPISTVYYESLEECFNRDILRRKVRRSPGSQPILTPTRYIPSNAQFIDLTVTGRETLLGTNEPPVVHRFFVVPRQPTDNPYYHLILGRDYLDARNNGAQLGAVDAQTFLGHAILSPNSMSIVTPNYSLEALANDMPGPSTGRPGLPYVSNSTYANPVYSDAVDLEDWDPNVPFYQG
ncbi:hypothetical protein O1611_g1854 [Lasiodiplodia mahajangana]|uniref:Uncharacterized protein n=1 Tax=Lasiodiplodia mahajangana TaxID=1108764 RepID=A0ACC2JWJ9_9PEZI|nr:hypothetical protein O1611_g1854 [Lasiodiplodia mahajangana]